MFPCWRGRGGGGGARRPHTPGPAAPPPLLLGGRDLGLCLPPPPLLGRRGGLWVGGGCGGPRGDRAGGGGERLGLSPAGDSFSPWGEGDRRDAGVGGWSRRGGGLDRGGTLTARPCAKERSGSALKMGSGVKRGEGGACCAAQACFIASPRTRARADQRGTPGKKTSGAPSGRVRCAKLGSHTAPRLCGDIEASFRRLTPRRWHRPAREGRACLTR